MELSAGQQLRPQPRLSPGLTSDSIIVMKEPIEPKTSEVTDQEWQAAMAKLRERKKTRKPKDYGKAALEGLNRSQS